MSGSPARPRSAPPPGPGRHEQAADHYEEACRCLAALGAGEDLPRLLARRARELWLLGDREQAGELLARAVTDAERSGSAPALVEVELVRAGLDLADGDLTTARDHVRRCPARTTSCPQTSARPASGRSSVARIRTMVVLPAPLGPSRPRTVPGGTLRSTPDRASVSPKRLVSPSVMMVSVMPVTMPTVAGTAVTRR